MARPLKPKGGRKSLVDELVRAAVINKSWQVVKDALTSESQLNYKEKVDVAVRIAAKTIPQNLDLTSGGQPFVIEIRRYNNDNENKPS